MTHNDLTLRYDNAAGAWTAGLMRLGYLRAYRSFAEWAIPLQANISSICDIGTGGGALADACLASRGIPAQLCLVDPSCQMLDEAAKLLKPKSGQLTLHCTTLESFNPPVPYDVVLAAHVIEHCPCPKTALAQLWNKVGPGGRLLLIVSRPHWCQWFIWLRWRHRWFSQRSVNAMAGDAGLPLADVFRFPGGPPQRTSYGYVFIKPNQRKSPEC